MSRIQVKPLRKSDRTWIGQLMREHWQSEHVVSRGRVHDTRDLPGFIAEIAGERIGFALYQIDGNTCELVVILSLQRKQGVGTKLLTWVKNTVKQAGCVRLWLITTNDNLPALGFYQKQGLNLVAVYPNAMTESRRLKPNIPLVGLDGIPLRDELELEMLL